MDPVSINFASQSREAHIVAAGPQAAPSPVFHDYTEDFSVYPAAGFALRWYALTLDLALSTPIAILVKLPFSRYLERLAAYGHQQEFLFVSVLLAAIPFGLYFLAPTVIWGATLGKKIVGLRVVCVDGHPEMSFGQVVIRETLGKLLSIASFGLGYLMVAISPTRRALHDHLGGTRVICYKSDD